MSELIQRLDRLFLKLDHTALLVEQSLSDILYAMESNRQEDADIVIQSDEVIDRREVEIERECIRLLALYQPAAIDLRRICFVIKVNSDLERIADLCVNMAKMMSILHQEKITIDMFPMFRKLAEQVSDALHQTVRLFSPQRSNDGSVTGVKSEEKSLESQSDIELAQSIIRGDEEVVDVFFREYLEEVFSENLMLHGKNNAIYALTSVGRSLERIGDLCTNIAEDAIFLLTGEIIRHGM